MRSPECRDGTANNGKHYWDNSNNRLRDTIMECWDIRDETPYDKPRCGTGESPGLDLSLDWRIHWSAFVSSVSMT